MQGFQQQIRLRLVALGCHGHPILAGQGKLWGLADYRVLPSFQALLCFQENRCLVDPGG
jgi:hypothetical protein